MKKGSLNGKGRSSRDVLSGPQSWPYKLEKTQFVGQIVLMMNLSKYVDRQELCEELNRQISSYHQIRYTCQQFHYILAKNYKKRIWYHFLTHLSRIILSFPYELYSAFTEPPHSTQMNI